VFEGVMKDLEEYYEKSGAKTYSRYYPLQDHDNDLENDDINRIKIKNQQLALTLGESPWKTCSYIMES
jgi:hypothetical protein